MTGAAERYAANASRFVELVESVPDDRWQSRTPCEEWTARDLVDHVVDTHHYFLGLIGIEAVEHPSVEDDPAGAVRAVTTQLAETMAEPALATKTYEGAFGTKPLEWGVDHFQTDDLVIHAWDLATAVDVEWRIPPEEIEIVRGHAEQWGDNVRSPGVMGPAVEVPEDADDQAKLLGYLGRASTPS